MALYLLHSTLKAIQLDCNLYFLHCHSLFPMSLFWIFTSSVIQGLVGLTKIAFILSGATLFRTIYSYVSRFAIMICRSMVLKFAKTLFNLVDISSVLIPFSFQYVYSLTSKGDLSVDRCDIILVWSERYWPGMESFTDRQEMNSLRIRSRVWSLLWLGKLTWFCKPKAVSKSKKTWTSQLVTSSTWRLKSPAIMILPYEVSTSSRIPARSSRNMASVHLLVWL